MPENNDCNWSKNDLSCVNTWAFLRGLGQLRPSFTKSKDLLMSDLAFWNPAASPEVRRREAREVAAQLDRIFRKALLAKYEEGFKFASAINALAKDLSSENETVCELAVTVDRIYNFRGEIR